MTSSVRSNAPHQDGGSAGPRIFGGYGIRGPQITWLHHTYIPPCRACALALGHTYLPSSMPSASATSRSTPCHVMVDKRYIPGPGPGHDVTGLQSKIQVSPPTTPEGQLLSHRQDQTMGVTMSVGLTSVDGSLGMGYGLPSPKLSSRRQGMLVSTFCQNQDQDQDGYAYPPSPERIPTYLKLERGSQPRGYLPYPGAVALVYHTPRKSGVQCSAPFVQSVRPCRQKVM